MGALPRPDVPPGPRRDLVDALHDLHHRAGWPSLRTLARKAGCSHTTVSRAFSSPKLPSWGTIEVLVEAMAGDLGTFRELWLAASRPPDWAAPPVPRIAGRREELGIVRCHLETGTGLLLVTGEAGIGKTRLVTTALDTAESFVATGHCLPLSTEVPLMPVVDVLRAVHAHDDGQWFKEALTDCPPYVREELARLLPELGDGAGDTVRDEFAQQRLFSAVERCLSRLHEPRPIGVIIEDLHWADAATLDLLEHLVVGTSALQLVATWRMDDPAVSSIHWEWLARVQRLPRTSEMELAPLTLAETAEQLALVSGSPVDRDLAVRIHDRSRGHPLFTEHLAAQSEGDTALPRQLSDVLDRRLDGLGDDAAAVTAALGVADRGLSDGLLREVTGLDHGQLVTALRALTHRRLMATSDGRTVHLRHPLLAEAARRRLVPGEVTRAHRDLACALAGQPGPDAAEVAEHWRHAGDRSQELGWRVVAARQAHARTAPGAEAAQWLRALEISEAEVAGALDPVRIRLEAFDALELAGQLDTARTVIREALPDVRDLDDLAAAEVLRRAAMAEFMVGDGAPSSLALVDRAIEILEPHDASDCLVHALDLRANGLIDLGRYEDALSSVQSAQDVCRELDDASLFFITSATLAWHKAHLGDLEGGLECIRAARERMPLSAGPRGEAYMASMHTDMLIQHRRPAEEVIQAAERALDIGREWQIDFHFLTLVGANVVEALINTGQVRRAAEVLADVPTSESQDDRQGRWISAQVTIAEGALDEGIQILTELHKSGTSAQSKLGQPVWIAVANLWKGQPDKAWAVLFPAVEEIVASPSVEDTWLAFVTLARAAADLATEGEHDPASLKTRLGGLRERAVVDPLGPAPSPIVRPAATAQWNAELARIDRHDAVQQWSRAATEWDALRSPHDAAYCRWRGAQVALDSGQGALATKLLRRAARDAREHVPLTAAIRGTAAR